MSHHTASIAGIPAITLPSGRLLLDGELVEPCNPARTIDAIDPTTGTRIMSFPACGREDVERAVQSAHRCFESKAWQGMRPLDRGRLLENLALLVERHRDDLAALESLDSGKLLAVTSAIDLQFTIDGLRYFAGWASKINGEYVTHNPLVPENAVYRAYTQRRPIGVTGGITPWNFPIGQAIQKIAPAIAFGCTVVLKPSEESSLTALRLGELIAEAGFPAGAVNIVTGYGADAGTALVEHPLVRKIAFTGSTATGQSILAASAATMKRVTLELGGKSPTIILADADLDRAIPGAAAAIFSNSGQICTAGSRLLVEDAVYDRVMDGVAQIASALRLGSPFDQATQIGPLISMRQRERVSSLVDAGVAEGAQIVAGGTAGEGAGWHYRPTVLANVTPDMTVMREEIFGPVVCATRITDRAQIVPLANDTPFGLAASIWTRNLDHAHLLAERIEAGTVWLNTHNVLDLAMPFGGSKLSGLGREFGSEAVHAFTEPKAVCMRLEGADDFG
ncbi:MAG: aldehyde dehydrogenase family protein [Alphaproteobacteria bacterium]|nr:aldehyde dehydrogenase family protein [Alphaproteobacteria bacterium]MBU0795234.1 aldehyde dehydrogenase family protein [Alphaproteobacteria bacterium]MBU0876676.1 aldehyde dehydrogenase family protein [Alphaproteobacteria bacterium]MBU1769378.1 aldehyde dehydrogenase family protein [Alphaproteobacteria bacterium]